MRSAKRGNVAMLWRKRPLVKVKQSYQSRVTLQFVVSDSRYRFDLNFIFTDDLDFTKMGILFDVFGYILSY